MVSVCSCIRLDKRNLLHSRTMRAVYRNGGSWQPLLALVKYYLARSGIDTDFEIFDEPTTHLSSEGIDDLLECLRDRALTQKRRIYLIDHHVLDRGAFDGVFTVIKSKEGIQLDYK
jgi:ABC-type transport system involved in cytochrome bd biosynthesis fused ATPase/permease subunit